MKQTRFLIIVFFIVFSLTVKSSGSPFSEGFEAGNYDGWTVTAEYGRNGGDGTWQYYDASVPGVWPPKPYPFDALTNPYIVQDIGFVSDGTAPEGTRYLKLTVGGGSRGGHYEARPFTAPNGDPYEFRDRNYGVVLSREFSIADGQALSLWVNFHTQDFPQFNYDDLQIRIDGAIIFRLGIPDVLKDFPEGGETGWRQVLWTPPAAGNYTLSLASFQDDEEFSSASFDGIMIVPEPAIGVIGMLGFALLGHSRTARQRGPNSKSKRSFK